MDVSYKNKINKNTSGQHKLIRHAGFSGLPNVILFNYIWLYFDKLVLLIPAQAHSLNR
jgi:hypothetical protein